MSDAATQHFDAIVPMVGISIQGQLGPDLVGSGSMVFRGPGTLWFFHTMIGESSVLYGNDGSFPDTPLAPNSWTPIPNVSNLNLSYSVVRGSDLKLVWAA